MEGSGRGLIEVVYTHLAGRTWRITNKAIRGWIFESGTYGIQRMCAIHSRRQSCRISWRRLLYSWSFRVRFPVGSLEISSDLVLLSAFSSPGVHSGSNRNEYQGISFGVKCARRVELTTLRSIVPTVKVRVKAQHSISGLSLYDLLRKAFTA